MSMYYTHTLIPNEADYVPRPTEVAAFFLVMVELGAAPSHASFGLTTVSERTGYTQKSARLIGRHAVTGEAIHLPPRYGCSIDDVSTIAPELDGLDEYDLKMSGLGPPTLPLFPLIEVGSHGPLDRPYQFTVGSCLRPQVVSMSDFTPVPHRQPGNPADRVGIFENYKTGEMIRVPDAGYARFWIEFAFGKWLFPQMRDNSLDLLPASVVDAAQRTFAIRFAQGCHWG